MHGLIWKKPSPLATPGSLFYECVTRPILPVNAASPGPDHRPDHNLIEPFPVAHPRARLPRDLNAIITPAAMMTSMPSTVSPSGTCPNTIHPSNPAHSNCM